MTSAIHWLLELEVQKGQEDTLRPMLADMSDSTRSNEPGALIYEWFIDKDETTVHISERYADSAAAMTHLKTFGENYAKTFLAVLKPTRLTVYGDPSAELRGALDRMGAVYFSQVGGFAR